MPKIRWMPLSSRFHRAAVAALALLLVAGTSACSKRMAPTAPGAGTSRTYRMGFSAIPPKADFALLLAALDMWRSRSDAAIMQIDPPWDTLLAGYPADSAVIHLHLGLADYFKGSGRSLVVMIDATNGLDRSSDAASLVARGRSLTEAAVQRVYRDFALAVDTLLTPSYLGLVDATLVPKTALAPWDSAFARPRS